MTEAELQNLIFKKANEQNIAYVCGKKVRNHGSIVLNRKIVKRL